MEILEIVLLKKKLTSVPKPQNKKIGALEIFLIKWMWKVKVGYFNFFFNSMIHFNYKIRFIIGESLSRITWKHLLGWYVTLFQFCIVIK